MLLACARANPDADLIRELASKELDWEWIASRADLYSLAPLVYSSLKELGIDKELTSSVAEKLRSTSRRSHAVGIYRALKLQEILAAFSREGISVVLLKGAALAITVYRSVGLRPMFDVDLLVRSNQLERAAGILRNLGYVSDESYATADWYKRHHHHLVPFVASDRSISIELHHHILSPRAEVEVPPDTFWQHAHPVSLGSESALVPAPEHLLISVCLHTALSQCFERTLRDIVDVAEILRRFETAFNWDLVLRDSPRSGAARALYYSLWFAQSTTGAPIPRQILQHLKAKSELTSLEDTCLRFLIPRAVFPDFTVIPPSITGDVIRAILVTRGHKSPATMLVRRFLHHLPHYSSQDHAKQSVN
jgi:hypothetical protein